MPREQQTLQPDVTGASVLAVKYLDGIMMCYDTLASYGSSPRFTGVDRVTQVGNNTLVAASGEISDFQYLTDSLHDLENKDWLRDDGTERGASEWANYISRICCQKRGEMNPLFMNVVIGGINKKGSEKPYYLATVDLHGTLFEEDIVATESGQHLALPIMRRKHRNNMTEAEAREMLEECMEVLFHRHCYCSNRVKFVTVTAEGSRISDEIERKRPRQRNVSIDNFVHIQSSQLRRQCSLVEGHHAVRVSEGVRIKRLEKLATRLHRKEQYFDGLRAAARMSMMSSGAVRIARCWPPFARYDSEGLLGMYIVERSMTTSTPPSVTPERTGHAGAMDEKAPTPAERARLSSETRGCESLPAFCKAVLAPQNMQASTWLKRRPRQLTHDVAVPRQPRIPVTWTHDSKLSESLHLWNPHEEK
ncbi:Proteasome subunit beta type-4, partial [Perkinsus olseni]